ncbi:MAG: GTPase ObgE [Verrucomicrobia bacterium]|jgi:GTP-binding protein|nr:GTPase ObgE [Verrucomicrobiota bacterium]NBS83319.1 GTPase ObgE [Verrucomicrobiota bacterium]
MFVDRVRIHARAGNGGRGAISFLREKFVPKGGPDGGDGGQGGDVVLEVDPQLNNLVDLRFRPHARAAHGGGGSGKNCTGRNGKSCLLKIPPGTVIYPLPPGEEGDPIADLTQPGEKFVLCQGGRGGRGNSRFASSVRQTPRYAEDGKPGEAGEFLLVLKSIAQVGLVGLPNAGKSSLLAALSAAKPKIAPYPFTTLAPYIGVVGSPEETRFTLADIPGLVEGAHSGKGLGHDFLRHIERCSVLLMVIDAAGTEGRDPVEDYKLLRKELRLHDVALGKRPFLIAANKCDLPEAQKHLANLKTAARKTIFPVSAQTGEGLEELIRAIRSLLPS